MKNFTFKILLFAALFPSLTFAQSTTFNIGNETYYLHELSYEYLSDYDPDEAFYNQNIVADNNYIYLADHTDKFTKTNHLKIKRYDALTGYYADNDIIISKEELNKFGIDKDFDDEHRCFYLVDCNDNDHLILFLNTSYSGNNRGILSGNNFFFYLINKEDGTIEKEFAAQNSTYLDITIMDFGIPQIIGTPAEGNFDIIVPMVSDIGRFSLVKYKFENFAQQSFSTIFYNLKSSNLTTGFSKPSIKIIDDNYLIVDDRNIGPSLYRHTYTPISDSLDEFSGNNISGNGCNILDLNGHRILCTGDIQDGNTHINIGLWDSNNTSGDDSSINFDSYSHLASLKFGPSTFKSGRSPYAYRQFIAVSDFNATTKHLHIYVPGEFISTYQINRYSTPTDIGYITEIPQDTPINYHISDNHIIFDNPVDNIRIYNLMGNEIFQSIDPIISINFSNFVSGAYIIVTPHQSIKILL